MSQKRFSEETGISQSTISEWKSKRTNPTSEKIMIICKVLDVTPEWLLSGIENTGDRGNNQDWYVIDKETEMGFVIQNYHRMDECQTANCERDKQRFDLGEYLSLTAQSARRKRAISGTTAQGGRDIDLKDMFLVDRILSS